MESKNTVRNRNTTNDRAVVLQLFTTQNNRAKYIESELMEIICKKF